MSTDRCPFYSQAICNYKSCVWLVAVVTLSVSERPTVPVHCDTSRYIKHNPLHAIQAYSPRLGARPLALINVQLDVPPPPPCFSFQCRANTLRPALCIVLARQIPYGDDLPEQSQIYDKNACEWSLLRAPDRYISFDT